MRRSFGRTFECIILQRTLLGFSAIRRASAALDRGPATSCTERRMREGGNQRAGARSRAKATTVGRSMTAQQRIVRVRRNYNQWVANQTLEDYALRFTAKSARKWSSFRGRQHRHRRGLVPRARSDRRLDHHQLRLHQCDRRDPRGRRADLPDLPADRLLRVALRRRHRPAHPRRRLRLYRLDDHVADLRLVHVPVLRHRSGDHVARAGNVLRHSAVRRLYHQLAGRHSAGHARHHLHQPLPALDAAGLDRAASPALRLHRVRRTSGSFEDGPALPASRDAAAASFNLAPVRHRRRPWCSR